MFSMIALVSMPVALNSITVTNLMPNFIKIIAIFFASVLMTCAHAGPPALTTSSFTKHDINYDQCQQRTKEILAKMNLEIEDHGNGTIGGFGEQSVAVVNCHFVDNTTYVQIAVASQKEEAAQMIMNYLVSYLKTSPAEKLYNPDTFIKPNSPQ